MKPLLVLRPGPGAAATLARATAAGFEAIAAPIFTLVASEWDAPDPARFDAVMLTSANAARLAGPAIEAYAHLPAYTVGVASAHAAIEAGFADVRPGNNDAMSLVIAMAKDGITRPLHLAGREHRLIDDAPFAIERRIVYASDAVEALPAAATAAFARGAVALLHSERACATLVTLLVGAGIDPATVSVAAISEHAAIGPWQQAAVAATPDDHALLFAAAPLCGVALRDRA